LSQSTPPIRPPRSNPWSESSTASITTGVRRTEEHQRSRTGSPTRASRPSTNGHGHGSKWSSRIPPTPKAACAERYACSMTLVVPYVRCMPRSTSWRISTRDTCPIRRGRATASSTSHWWTIQARGAW